MVDYFKLALSRYAEFTGRSRRSEFWYYSLGVSIVSIIITILGGILDAPVAFSVLSMLWSLATFVPSLAVSARRLHDTGHSGWWLLIALTGIGSLLLLYWFVLDSEPGTNKYGHNPKTGATDDVMRHLID